MPGRIYDGWFALLADMQAAMALAACPARLPDVRAGNPDAAEYFWLVDARPADPPGTGTGDGPVTAIAAPPHGLGLFHFPRKPAESVFNAWLEHARPAGWWRARMSGNRMTLLDRADGSPRFDLQSGRVRQLASTRAALSWTAGVHAPPGTRRATLLAVPRNAAAGLRLLRDLLRHERSDAGPLVRDIRMVPVHVIDPKDPGRLRRTSGALFEASLTDLPLLIPDAAFGEWDRLSARLIDGTNSGASVVVYRMFEDAPPAPTGNGTAGPHFIEHGVLPSGVHIESVSPPAGLQGVDAVPVWRACLPDPVAWAVTRREQTLARPLSLLVARERLGERVAAGASPAPEPFRVPFRLVPGGERSEPRAWLMREAELARLKAVIAIQPASRMDGFELAAVPPVDGWLLQRRETGEFLDIDGIGFAPLPGCPRVLAPVGWTLRPRVNPVRLPALLDLPADAITLLVPDSLRDGGTTTGPDPDGNGHAGHTSMPEAFTRVQIRRTAFERLTGLVEYSLELSLSARVPLTVPRLLDESVFERPRHWASLAHRAFLDLKQTGRISAPRAMPTEDNRPAPRSSVAAAPEPVPERPTRITKKKKRKTSRVSAEPVAQTEPDKLLIEERRLEEQLAAHLLEPEDPELKLLWFRLGRVKRQRGKPGEALYCQVNARWLQPATSTTATLAPEDLHQELEWLAAVTPLAEALREAEPQEILRTLEAGKTWTAEHFIWLLYLVGEVSGESDRPAELVIGLQRFIGRLRSVLPYKLRWLLALAVARLSDDEIALEREREDLIGELNLRGLAVQNLEPLVSELLGRRSVRTDGSPARSQVASTRWAADETAEPGEKWARAWPDDALKAWTTALCQIPPPHPSGGSHRGHDSTRFFIALGEMLLTVSRQWGARHLPLEDLWKQVHVESSPLLADVVKMHLAEYASDRQSDEDARLAALDQAVRGSATADPDSGGRSDRSFAGQSPELRSRISRYFALLGQRWASPGVRDFWRSYFHDAGLQAELDMIGLAPREWFALLGHEYLTRDLLERVEQQMAAGGRTLKPSGQAALIRLLDQAVAVCRSRDLPQLLGDDMPLPPNVGEEASQRYEDAFELQVSRLNLARDIEELGPAIASLEHIDAPGLEPEWQDPRSDADWRWLQGYARVIVANAIRLCRCDQRNAALELVEQLVEAWRTTYPHVAQLKSAAVRSHVKWLVRGVLEVVPLIGNRTAGTRLINTCIEHGRTGDAYTQAELFSAAARALALLGEKDEAEAILTRILAGADENLHDDDLLMFEVLEQVISAGLELLEPAVFRQRIAAPVARMMGRHFQGPAGAFYKLQVGLHARFAEWSLDPGSISLPPLKAKKDIALHEADRRDLALYWSRQYLHARAYEKDASIANLLTVGLDFVGPDPEKTRKGALARDLLQALTDHFLGEGAAEHKALHDYRRLDETLIRNRVAWEQL